MLFCKNVDHICVLTELRVLGTSAQTGLGFFYSGWYSTLVTLVSYSQLLWRDDINVPDTELERVDNNPNLSRLQSVLELFRLMPISNPFYTVHQFTLLAMLYVSPRQVQAAKMLEALCRRADVHDADMELRCVQAVTAMYDTAMRENI